MGLKTVNYTEEDELNLDLINSRKEDSILDER